MDSGDEAECECGCLATDGSGTSDAGDPLEVDALLASLEHPRRRYLLYALGESTEVTLTDLAARIVSSEEDVPVADVDETDRDRAFIALYHAHVPKLEREGVVDFDRATETVRLGPNGRQALDALERIGGARDASLEDHAKDDDRD